MLIEYPESYNRFSCLKDECPDTCCKEWEVDIDEESRQYYMQVPGPFGERLRSHMTQEEGECFFAMTEEGNCPFLDKKGLCEMYTALGEESLCRVCTEYPRYYMEIGNYEQIDMSLSCPALGRLLFEGKGPILYERAEDEGIAEELSLEEEERLAGILDLRDEAIMILQGKTDLPLKERLKEADLFYEEDDRALMETAARFEILSSRCAGILDGISANLEGIQRAEAQFDSLHGEKYDAWFTKLSVYLTWRYMIDLWFDSDKEQIRRMISRSLRLIKLMCVSRFAGYEPETDRIPAAPLETADIIDLAHYYSKQVEHSDENVSFMKGL